MRENWDFVLPVNILTPFASPPPHFLGSHNTLLCVLILYKLVTHRIVQNTGKSFVVVTYHLYKITLLYGKRFADKEQTAKSMSLKYFILYGIH